MFELDLERAGRRYGPEWLEAAAWYRANSLAVVTNPDFVLEHTDHPSVDQKMKAEFNANTRRRAEMFEALAYGDSGFLLTTPGPSLSGVLVRTLGDEAQWEYFQDYVLTQRCRTFFAVTEPGRGSDAANLETRLLPNGELTGEKLLFGNGAVAPLGTVLVRTGDGALDMAAVLLPPALVGSEAVSAYVLDMFAMRGAQLSYMRFDRLGILEHLVLGRHLKAAERGLMGMVKTFHMFRPTVAAMAIGHGQALVDYARRHFAGDRGLVSQLDHFDHLLAQVRALNLVAADAVDADPARGALVSLAKCRATRAAEQIVTTLSRLVPAAALVEHAWLAKSLADVYAYEFMEGTTPIQLANVHGGFLRREIVI